MGYYLWGHNGSADHADEDWIRGSCRLLSQPPSVISRRPEEELRYGIGHLASLWDRLPEGAAGWALTRRIDSAELLRKSGLRPVLWGWHGAGMSRKLRKDLEGFHTLVVSDRQSLSVLRTAGLAKKVRLGPDPSFLVERRLRPLSGAFPQDTIGLCLSAEPHPKEALLYQSYQRLIRYIMTQTDCHVALIPYCAQRGREDAILHAALEKRFRGWGRVRRRGDGSCQVLRGDLSLCRCVVGSAGAVAAWSCGVPALCVGATPRFTGLAQELFSNWEDAVVPISSLSDSETLTRRFRKFLRGEERLRKELERAVPLQRQRGLDWKWEF